MKLTPFLPFVLAGVVAGLPAASRGAVVLAVDLGLTGTPVETGFQGFFVSNGTANGNVSATFGANTVTIFGGTQAHNPQGVSGRDRSNPLDAGAFTYGDLLRDLVTRFESSTGAAAPLTSFQITGLTPSTQYIMQIWSLDYPNNNNSVSTWYDMVPAVPVSLGTITNLINTTPTNNNQFSVTGIVSSDAAGLVKIGSNFTAGAGQLNGFQLSTIPEPGCAALCLVAGLVLRRRNRI